MSFEEPQHFLGLGASSVYPVTVTNEGFRLVESTASFTGDKFKSSKKVTVTGVPGSSEVNR